MEKIKRIALVAHDNRKKDLIEWAEWNYNFEVMKLKSGPLGGDQQLGAMIAEDKVDLIIFLWDPMQPQPHDVDVKALLRISVLYNIPTACNRSTADFMISSPLLDAEYEPVLKDYSGYIGRTVRYE